MGLGVFCTFLKKCWKVNKCYEVLKNISNFENMKERKRWSSLIQKAGKHVKSDWKKRWFHLKVVALDCTERSLKRICLIFVVHLMTFNWILYQWIKSVDSANLSSLLKSQPSTIEYLFFNRMFLIDIFAEDLIPNFQSLPLIRINQKLQTKYNVRWFGTVRGWSDVHFFCILQTLLLYGGLSKFRKRRGDRFDHLLLQTLWLSIDLLILRSYKFPWQSAFTY